MQPKYTFSEWVLMAALFVAITIAIALALVGKIKF